jgi:hypothetical protein
MEMPERSGDLGADLDAFLDGTDPEIFQIRRKSPGFVVGNVNLFSAMPIVGEIHYIVVESRGAVPSDVKDVDEPGVALGYFFVSLDTLKFPLESPLVFEVLPPDHFDRPIAARDAAGEKNLSVRSSANAADDLVIRDCGDVRFRCDNGSVAENGRVAMPEMERMHPDRRAICHLQIALPRGR